MYGFNLGQIEGLDSSVQTVTVTIANATESNTYTLTYISEGGGEFWTDDYDNASIWLYYLDNDTFDLEIANFTESDVGDTYNVTISTSAVEENFKSAVETVLVDNGLISPIEIETLFDGTITITDQMVEIPFDMDVSSYPFEKWTVTVNDEPLEYNGEFFINETETHVYVVGNNDGVYIFLARGEDGVIPGDYQVKIVGQAGGGGSSGLPDVSASDNGSVLGVVNGEWGVDDRLKDYPSISNNNGAVLGFGIDRDGNRIAQAIIPAPMNRTKYNTNTFFIPFVDESTTRPIYTDIALNARPQVQGSAYANILVDNSGTFKLINAPLRVDRAGTYTLKAIVDSNGTISFQFVADT